MALPRRTLVEGVGSFLLMLAATGSSLSAQRLFPDHPGFVLLASAGTIAGALAALIVAFGSASGGHFNPLITVLQWLARERRLDCTSAYVAAQLVGCILGAVAASAVFGAHAAAAPLAGADWRLISSEVLATAGLMIVVFGCARSGKLETGPFAVGAWLAGAIVATPSTSYANPAITLAALFASGPIALSADTAVFYIFAEIAGGLIAFLVVRVAYPALPATEGIATRQTLAARENAT